MTDKPPVCPFIGMKPCIRHECEMWEITDWNRYEYKTIGIGDPEPEGWEYNDTYHRYEGWWPFRRRVEASHEYQRPRPAEGLDGRCELKQKAAIIHKHYTERR